MRILDWRRWPERHLGTGSGCQTWPARLAGRVADTLAARRVARRSAPPARTLAVAVGNLRIGGTGKSPVVLALARDLAAAGVSEGAILLRGHGSPVKGPLAVRPDDESAADEARLLAAGLVGHRWQVVQARRRSAGLNRLLLGRPRPQVVLLEDGYQTAGIGRHLDVLILDRWRLQDGRLAAQTGAVLPCGPYRETHRGAARAQVWLLETDDPATLAATPGWPGGPEILGFGRRHALQIPAGVTAAVTTDAQWALLAGLARPERFEAAAGGLLSAPPILAVRCGDHCAYEPPLVARIVDAGRQAGVTAWVTTSKDWIKLASRWPQELPVMVVAQEVAWRGGRTLPQLVLERLAALTHGTDAR
jgi:tetraacyldisaccharide 4'-kinase